MIESLLKIASILIGAAVYSSELLLNEIVTQKMEYERLVLLSFWFGKLKSNITLIKSNIC